MVAHGKGGQASKRCRKSRFRWSWIETRRRERVQAIVKKAHIQPQYPRFQLGQINNSGGFPSCWRQHGMDEYISVGHDLGSPSTFSVQEDVELGHTTNNEVRTMNVEEFVQVTQQGFDHAEKILEQNQMLIQEISQNKETCDTDGLARNADLIRRLNTNIAHVFDLYSNLTGSFNDFVSAKNADNTGSPSASDSSDP